MILTNRNLDMQTSIIIPVLTEEEKEARAAKSSAYVKAPEGYSDVFAREAFFRTSFHCPGRNIAIQASNILEPDENDESHWVNVTATMDGYVCTDLLFRWFRVQGVQAGDRVYVQSLQILN